MYTIVNEMGLSPYHPSGKGRYVCSNIDYIAFTKLVTDSSGHCLAKHSRSPDYDITEGRHRAYAVTDRYM